MATHEIDGKWWTRAASLGLRPRLPIRSPHLVRARFGCFERLDCAEPVGREAGCGRRFNGGRCVVAARCLKALAERENSFGNVHMQAPLIRPHSEPSPFARCQNAFERCILERSEASCSYNHLVRAQFGRLCVVRLVYLGDPVPKTKRPCRVRASSMEARFQCRVLFHPASMRSHALSASGLSHGARSRQRCR